MLGCRRMFAAPSPSQPPTGPAETLFSGCQLASGSVPDQPKHRALTKQALLRPGQRPAAVLTNSFDLRPGCSPRITVR